MIFYKVILKISRVLWIYFLLKAILPFLKFISALFFMELFLEVLNKKFHFLNNVDPEMSHNLDPDPSVLTRLHYNFSKR